MSVPISFRSSWLGERKCGSWKHEDRGSLDGLDIERVPGDVRDRESLRRAFEGADVVFHLAAVISICGERGGLVPAVNVEGARSAAEVALEQGVRRFVHCCSIHAFMQRPLEHPLDETRERVPNLRGAPPSLRPPRRPRGSARFGRSSSEVWTR